MAQLRFSKRPYDLNWAQEQFEKRKRQEELMNLLNSQMAQNYGSSVISSVMPPYQAQQMWPGSFWGGDRMDEVRDDIDPNQDKGYMGDTLSFGKYAGQKLSDVPKDYIEWLISTREKDIKQYRAELERREMLETQASSTLDKIIQEGFKALAKKAHPDQGGSDKQFRELQAAREQLKLAAEEVKRVQGTTTASSI